MTICRIQSAIPYDSNIYLISGEHPVLVDTGTGEDSPGVIESIRSIGIIPESIILTHCHYDHAGGVRNLVDAFGCQVYAGFEDCSPLRESDPLLTASYLFNAHMDPIQPNPLQEGSEIDTGDHSFRVLVTPGHTQGGICLFEESTGILISGDTLFLDGIGRTDLPGGSSVLMRMSLTRFSKIDIRELFPGHGDTCGHYTRNQLDWVLRMAGV